jgi:hypothetical protein
MDNRIEITRVDREIGVALAMPPAEAARRLAEIYRIAESKDLVALALIGRLVATVHGATD